MEVLEKMGEGLIWWGEGFLEIIFSYHIFNIMYRMHDVITNRFPLLLFFGC